MCRYGKVIWFIGLVDKVPNKAFCFVTCLPKLVIVEDQITSQMLVFVHELSRFGIIF